MKGKCKHDIGWCIKENTYLYTYNEDKKNKVVVGFERGGDKRGYKVLMRCNNPDCDAVRNVYISASVKRFGRVITNKKRAKKK